MAGPLVQLGVMLLAAYVGWTLLNLYAGTPPLRCGRAIYFRRRDWDGLVGKNRFHRDDIEAAE